MIELDVNLSYLTQYFHIDNSRLSKYKNKSIDEILEEEVALGNLQALEYASFISDPEKLSELYQLANFSNKFLIIKNLDSDTLEKILEKLPAEDLLAGINYFNQDKIMEMLQELPAEQLISVVFEKFMLQDIVALMNTGELDKFFESPEVETDKLKESFASLNKQLLDKIMLESLNQDTTNKSKDEVLKQINDMNNTQFKEFIGNMDKFQKQNIVFIMCKNDDKLIQEIEPEALARPLLQLDKTELIQSMSALEPDFLLPMIQELPEELMQVVAAQIEANEFADIIIRECPEILQQIKI